MVHLRSPEKKFERKETREKKRLRRRIEHYILFDYSYHDWQTTYGEICHTTQTEPIVYEKIKAAFGDNNSLVCAPLEYGQVLNPKRQLLVKILTGDKFQK